MVTLQDILADLDDLKSALYECEDVDANLVAQAQELLREVYYTLEGE
jgi:hypothetical protein